MSKYDIMM